MLRAVHMTSESRDIDKMEGLYERAFPANERRSFADMMASLNDSLEALGLYDGDEFCGLAFLLNCRDISHIIYLAIDEKLRGHGYGSQALQIVHGMKKGMRIIVDIERDDVPSHNQSQRSSRKRFYLRNGYSETEVRYNWRGEAYEILSCGGQVTGREFDDFWRTLDKRMDVSEL